MSEPAVWFVCVLGISVVFIGLLFLVGIIFVMNGICNALANKNNKNVNTTISNIDSASENVADKNRQEILAAVCAAVAEENNTDISAIRVISFKRV